MTNYDYYNREERAICAHLFRLLHEKLDDKLSSPLGQLINMLSKSNLKFKNGTISLTNLRFDNIAIYCEASIIRDSFQNSKPNILPFMDDLTRLIIKQEGVSDCRLYSELPEPLNNSKKTHPKQIFLKAISQGIPLNNNENKVYGAIQSMFNAKPDLVITIDNLLLVCEAKHTEKFDELQLKRTWNIAEVWASLLFKDFGFNQQPIYSVFTLGSAKYLPNISWNNIHEISEKTFKENDRTRIAIKAGLEILNRMGYD